MVSITSSVEKYLLKSGPSWANIYDGANADSLVDAIIYAANGKDSTNFYISRSACIYDTSGIPVGACLTQCRLYFYPTAKYDEGSDSILVIRSSDWLHPSSPVVVGDYIRTYWSSVLGTKTIASFTVNAWNYIDLDLTNGINKGGETRYYIVSGRDYSNTGPSSQAFNGIYCIDTNKTYLDIAYTLGGKKKVAIIV